MKKSDQQLGMGRDISRRDFIHDVSLASLGLTLPASVWAETPTGLTTNIAEPAGAYYPPTRTGMRGSHPGAFEVAHALAREGKGFPDPIDLDEEYDLVVVGGGNVAMDSVRTARRLGATEAIIAYRRGRDELPARAEEVHHAEEEGVRFELMVSPVRIIGDDEGWVSGIECLRMELGDPDDSGRRRPRAIPGSEHIIDCDMVVVAIGTRSNPMLTASEPDLEVNEWGYLVVDEDGMTSAPGVFAGGDIVRGAATVILAMGDGKRAAHAIERYLDQVSGLPTGAVVGAGSGERGAEGEGAADA